LKTGTKNFFKIVADTILTLADEPAWLPPVDETKLPLPTLCAASHHGKVTTDEHQGNSISGSLFQSFHCDKDECSNSPEWNFYHRGSSHQRSPPPSPPTIVDYQFLQDACWSNAQPRTELGYDQQSILRPISIHHQPSTSPQHLTKLDVILPQIGHLSQSNSQHEPATRLTSKSSTAEKHPFAFNEVDKNSEELVKINESSALKVITTREEMKEKDPSCEKQYLPCQQRNFYDEKSSGNLLKRKLDGTFKSLLLIIYIQMDWFHQRFL